MQDQQPQTNTLPEPLDDLSGDELKTLAQLARQQNAAQQPATPSQPGGPSMGRRGLMAGGGLGLLGLLASAGGASAAADPNDGDGDLGNNGPWDVWADGLALVTQDVSTSTTVDKPIVRYDSTPGTLTLTIDSSLEGPAGFSQPMWFLDQTGNADTNPVTVKDSSGTTIATIPAENSIFSPVWDGSEWLTTRFIESLNAGTVTTGKVDTTTPSGVTAVKRVHPGFQVLTSDEFDLADDATQTLLSGIDAGDVLTVWICNTDSGRAAVFQASGANVTLAEEGFNGSWEPSDTDGANCLFNSGGDLVVKNRTGSAAQTYRVVANHLTDGTI